MYESDMQRGGPVINPAHYNAHPSGVECIDIVKHMNFCCGNAVKYIWRAGDKGNYVQDLRKAINYLEYEIERYQNGPGKSVQTTE